MKVWQKNKYRVLRSVKQVLKMGSENFIKHLRKEVLEFTCVSNWRLHTKGVGVGLKCKSTRVLREYWNFRRSTELMKVAGVGQWLESLL